MRAEAAKASPATHRPAHRRSSIEVAEDYVEHKAPAAFAGMVHPKLKDAPGGCRIAACAFFFNVAGVSIMIAYYMALGGCEAVRALIDGDWGGSAYSGYADFSSGYIMCTSETYIPDTSWIDDAAFYDDDDDWYSFSYSYDDDDSRRRLNYNGGLSSPNAWISCHLPSLKCSDYNSNGACSFKTCSDDRECTGAVSITFFKCMDFWEALPLAQGQFFCPTSPFAEFPTTC